MELWKNQQNYKIILFLPKFFFLMGEDKLVTPQSFLPVYDNTTELGYMICNNDKADKKG